MVATIAPVPPAAPSAAPPAKAVVADKRAAATELRSVRFAKSDDGFSVTLAGNGPLLAASVQEAKDLPPRVLLDFHDVAAGSARATTSRQERRRRSYARRDQQPQPADHASRDRPRTQASLHSREQIGEDLRVMFRRAVDTAAAVVASAQPEPKQVEEPVMSAPVPETPDASPTTATAGATPAPSAVANRPPIVADAAPVPMPAVPAHRRSPLL